MEEPKHGRSPFSAVATQHNNPSSKPNVHLELVALLDDLADGERLPSERALAEDLGVSRRDLRKALATLEAGGLVWRGVGRGTFKGRPPLREHLGFENLKHDTNPLEIMEARLVLEPEIARLAAVRASNADLASLNKIVARARRSTDFETFSSWDSRFHQSIAKATRHQLFIALYGVVDNLRAELAWGKLQRRSRTTAWLEQASREHDEICLALSDRDPDGAADLMLQHLRAVYSVLITHD